MKPNDLNIISIYNWNSSFKVVILKFFIVIFAVAERARQEPIIIKNNGEPLKEDLNVIKGANVTFTCESSEPVHWVDISEKFPLLWTITFAWDSRVAPIYMSAAKLHDGKFHLYPEYTEHGKYIAKLDLFNVDHNSVGNYYCIKNSTIISEPNDLKTHPDFRRQKFVYLHVEDDNRHVFKIHEFIWVWDNCPKLYPCKATSLNKNTTLRVNQKRDQNSNWPKIGYQLESANLTGTNKFECSSLDHREMYEVRVQIESPSPTCSGNTEITSKTENFLIKSVNLELNCLSNCDGTTPQNITWLLPNNNIAITEGRAQRQKINKKNVKLIVTNVTSTKDLGEYKCVVDCFDVNYTVAFNITTALESKFFNITNVSQVSHIESNTNESNELFLVKYRVYPEAKLEWLDSLKKSIPWTLKEDLNKKLEAFHDPKKKWIALKIRNSTILDSGNYTLVVRSPIMKTQIFELFIAEKPHVRIEDQRDGNNITIICEVYGYPASSIKWIVNDNNGTQKPVEENSIKTFSSTAVNQTSILQFNLNKSAVSVSCYAQNKEGGDKSNDLIIHSIKIPDPSNTITIAVTSCVAILAVIFLAFMIIKAYLWRKRPPPFFPPDVELLPEHFGDFLEGDPESINPDMTLDDQVGLLPYKGDKYEFPRERLTLDKHIGAGAFGMVSKGTAHGILPNEKETTVAVKTVKQAMDSQEMRALMSELKILANLGKHLNVVNLLGAVTKNVSETGEFMVIVEYCEFGNLENFLKNNRHFFIDEIERTNDAYVLVRRNRLHTHSNSSGYLSMNSGVTTLPDYQHQHSQNSAYSRETYARNYSSADTAIVQNSQNEHSECDCVSVEEIAGHSNGRLFTTTDLIRWSLQVAQGMTYLSSRNVLHGDLAARNILLCSNNVVKICDFGLARSVYKRENYHKTSETPLPFKWMAIESLRDNIFSTYSDVWSFGVVMWEMFSLGRVPYPGMDPNQELYNKLTNDYRMEKPEYATPEIYNIMLSCWEPHPRMRPLFDILEKEISDLLEHEDIEHYTRLNEPYMQRNKSEFANNETDYLKQVASPRYVSLPMPELTQIEQNIIKSVQTSAINNKQSESIKINNQLVEIAIPESTKTEDLPPITPSIMTNYLSLNEILNVPNRTAESPSEEIEMRQQNPIAHTAYMRMSDILSSIWNSTNDQKPFSDNYINSSKLEA